MIIYKPTNEEIEALREGDYAIDPYGKWSRITRIFGRGQGRDGKSYICYYTQHIGGPAEISHSMVAGRIVLHLGINGGLPPDAVTKLDRSHPAGLKWATGAPRPDGMSAVLVDTLKAGMDARAVDASLMDRSLSTGVVVQRPKLNRPVLIDDEDDE